MLSLNDLAFRWSWADLPDFHQCDLGLEETPSHAFYHCPQVHLFWHYVGELMTRIASEYLLSIDLAYAYDNLSPPYSVEKRMMFFTLLTVARMVIWTLRTEGILRYERYYYRDLSGFFGHQLKMKIRCDKKRLLSRDFREKWIKVVSLVQVNRARLFFFRFLLTQRGSFMSDPSPG